MRARERQRGGSSAQSRSRGTRCRIPREIIGARTGFASVIHASVSISETQPAGQFANGAQSIDYRLSHVMSRDRKKGQPND